MATLNVKSVPDDLYEALRSRAREQGRSIRGEVIRILTEALQHGRRDPMSVLACVRELRRDYGPSAPGPGVDEMLAEDRTR